MRRRKSKLIKIREWEEGDHIEVEDLPFWDSRKPQPGMEISKLDGRDHVTTFSESKKGRELGLYIKVSSGSHIFV